MADAGDVRRMERIIDRLRGYGVTIREVSGWQERGRTFAYVPVGIVDHHDASTRKAGEWGALGIITLGRAGISGPLSQFQVARCLDGIPKVAIVAAGRANHAGVGGPRTLGGRLVAANQGNALLYGAEKANDGLGEPYHPAAHYATDALFAAVLAEIRGDGPGRVVGHKEWTSRKGDPTYSMDWRRARVVTFGAPAPPLPTLPAEEDEDVKHLIVKDPGSTRQYLVVPGVSRKHITSTTDLGTYRALGAVDTALTQAELDSYPDVTPNP